MKPTKLKPLKSTQSCAFNGLGELILSNTMTPPTQEDIIVKLNEIITQLNILIDNSTKGAK